MNLLVTVDATPLDEPVAAVSQRRAVVDGRRMSSADVAPLTKHRQLGHQHPVVDRAVRVVTRAAGLPAGGVIPQERTALLGMAREAGFVDVVAHLQQLHVRGAVRVVAARAGHLSFANRHVHGALRLLHLHLVAGAAEGELVNRFQLRLLGDRLVHGVACGAANVAGVVRAARPERVIALVVAGHADGAGVTRGHLRELVDVPLRVVVDVRLAGPVAALAAMLSGRRSRIARHAVLCTLEGLIGMARGARIIADIAGVGRGLSGLRRGLCLRNAQPAGIDRRAIEKGQPAREQQSGTQAGEELVCKLMSSHAMTPRR